MTEAWGPGLASVMINEDARFVIPEDDWYWNKHIKRGFYEPEIERVLRRAADRPYVLIDAGANFGYWSIVASSAPYGRHPAVAIEASRGNFALLGENARANGNRFHVLHRAVLDASGQRVSLFGQKHYGMSILKDWHPEDDARPEEVETVALDDVAAQYFPRRDHPPIVKIDVEGVEIEAIRGARALVEEGALLIYEDHGKEASHRISRFVLSLPDFEVWRVAREGAPLRIASLDQVGAVKESPNKGYNFFAYRRPSPWADLFVI